MENELRKRVDLLIGGIQIQNRLRNGIGTLGCIVFDRKTGRPLGLTNKHILSRRIGKSVVQPALKPRTDKFIIGKVFNKSDNYDCAVFLIDEQLRSYDKENSLFSLNGKVSDYIEP